jgi:hypothetical protein
MNWGKIILGEFVDENEIFFIKVNIDNTAGNVSKFMEY